MEEGYLTAGPGSGCVAAGCGSGLPFTPHQLSTHKAYPIAEALRTVTWKSSHCLQRCGDQQHPRKVAVPPVPPGMPGPPGATQTPAAGLVDVGGEESPSYKLPQEPHHTT